MTMLGAFSKQTTAERERARFEYDQIYRDYYKTKYDKSKLVDLLPLLSYNTEIIKKYNSNIGFPYTKNVQDLHVEHVRRQTLRIVSKQTFPKLPVQSLTSLQTSYSHVKAGQE